jgi:hypothetical protein
LGSFLTQQESRHRQVSVIADVGQKIMTAMSNQDEDANLKFWRALHSVLKDAISTLPCADEPKRVHWDHPDDDWKNDAENKSKEDECSIETDELIRHFCARKAWPKRSKNNARYFAEKRIEWALSLVRVFTIPLEGTEVAAIPRPSQSGWKLIEWFLIEAYQNRFPPPQKTPFYVSGSDGSIREIWT